MLGGDDLRGEEGGRLRSAIGGGGLCSATGGALGFLSSFSPSPEIGDEEGT
ncbi:hypothetical protein TIFTF001_028539 [Ficus carica]|uniref:Uncharacterized protein n=1 Tax=Ficus carica TaxID=3494 RepID=A0AA88J097_FICCA|nr:hypothetical protein TIFTF001_028539 [Ficus carica]